MTGQQCQQIRTRLGLSLRQLAERLGCSYLTIHAWERERPDKPIPSRWLGPLALAFLHARAERRREQLTPRKVRPGRWGARHGLN